MVALVRLGLSNIDSVARAIEGCGRDVVVTESPEIVRAADVIVVPGVGAFAEAMKRLDALGLRDALNDAVVGNGVPYLGICLGMQLLATTGLETARTPGLGWISGTVRRFRPRSRDTRVPHVGWNAVIPVAEHPIFRDIPPGGDFYFVHSYHLECDHPSDVLATTPYCGSFVSAVHRGNIVGVQFHPEKSQRWGAALLNNFLSQAT